MLDVYTRVVDQQKREASLKVVGWMLPVDLQKISAPFRTLGHAEGKLTMPPSIC